MWVSTKHLVVETRVVNKLDRVVHEFHVFQRRSVKKEKRTRTLFTKIGTQSNARKHVDWRCTWDFSDNFNIGVRDGSVLTSELMSWDEMAVVKSNADRLNKNSDFPSVTCFYHQSFFIDLGRTYSRLRQDLHNMITYHTKNFAWQTNILVQVVSKTRWIYACRKFPLFLVRHEWKLNGLCKMPR